MNLADEAAPMASPRVPHTRGDEPAIRLKKTGNTYVFPTPVGMNR